MEEWNDEVDEFRTSCNFRTFFLLGCCSKAGAGKSNRVCKRALLVVCALALTVLQRLTRCDGITLNGVLAVQHHHYSVLRRACIAG
jgi:hypothetical protein